MGNLPFLPEQASTFARPIDNLYFVLIGLSAVFTIPIVLLLIYFAVKYRRGSKADRKQSRTPHWLEWSWIGGLFILTLPVFIWSASTFFTMFRPPADSMEIYVLGRQWMWKFQHPSGPREINELHIPVGRPIKLLMTSEDVIHSFYVPAFRTKHDVLPGRYTSLWFEATKTGTYHMFCAEYCGTEHANMIGQVTVMAPAEYEEWLSAGGQVQANAPGTPESMAEAGGLLFQRNGCAGCHLADGNGQGPRLVGVFGAQVQLEGGEVVVADESYIRESIINPNAKIVRGYPPIMPSYAGQLGEEELMQLIAYIRSLGDEGGTDGADVPGDVPSGTSVPGGTGGTATPAATNVP